MRVKTIAKLAVTLMLGASLAACVDGTVEVAVTGGNSARATITQVMGADFYAMVKRSAEQGEAVTDDFCGEGELTEHEDGSATCIFTREGTLAEMSSLGDGENGPTLTADGSGLVRVVLPTTGMVGDLGARDKMDEQTKQMLEAYFTGRTITIQISGAEVIETNMDLSEDGKSAETVFPFLDLIKGAEDLPAEFFAVVRAP